MKGGRIPEHFQMYMSVEEGGALHKVLKDVLDDGQFDLDDDEREIVEEVIECLEDEV